MKPIRIAFLLLPLMMMPLQAEPLPEEVVRQLSFIIRLNCPEAVIENTGDHLVAHYSPPSGAQTDPQTKAFYLELKLKPGPSGSERETQEELQKVEQTLGIARQTPLPEDLRNAFFGLFHYVVFDSPRAADERNHYWVYLSFPRIDSKLIPAIWKALPKGNSGSPEGRLSLYNMETQLGTTACRVFTNEQGLTIQEIHYGFGTSLVVFTRFYVYDDKKREIWNGEYTCDGALKHSSESFYDEQGRQTLCQARNADGIVRYKILSTPKGKSHLHYDASGERVVSIQGVIPDGIDPSSVKLIK